ncbi:hypothetical protein GGU10DRAFT_379675 [Lentinula aff. detonsa]|uniref:DUF6534 domain-containing protein n=1 Tax=Lentinula aff. detonsa TaxID=2804958 RepID=A0AA38KNZ6_9AGAR|nr:hypothetical protein GGU10DRAFT_379675 [Lentinula aff. detonsa]
MSWNLNGLNFAINVGEIYGGMMVGLLMAALLCGTASMQAVIFFCTKNTDPFSHKLTVGILWVLGVLQLCFVFNATYFYVVDEVGISSPPFIWSFKTQIMMQTLIMSSTKFLYASRLWKLRKFVSKWVPIGLIVVLTCDYDDGVRLFAYEVFTVDVLRDLPTVNFKPIVILSMCSTSISDFLVGGTLIYAFAKSDTNLSWTNSSCTMLVAYLVNTGIITGLFSVAVIIAFAIGVQNPMFILSEIALPQLYINCCLSMFNASVYFQTDSNSKELPVTHVLREFQDENSTTATFPGGNGVDTWSSRINFKLSSDENIPTINEIGLPLFKVDDEPQPAIRQIPVEIVMKRTQHAITSGIRSGRGTVVVHS